MAMPYEFNTPDGQTVGREMLIACLNTGTKEAPVWSIVGKRVTSSSTELDWQRESSTDIIGETTSKMSKPVVTQSFDPWPLANGDDAQRFVWERGIRDQDAQALANVDMLIVHKYAGTANTAVFAERYESCSIEINSYGGDGGGNIAMPITVTFGGTRTVGAASVTGGNFVFTADSQ